MCQNSVLAHSKAIEYSVEDIVARYQANPISHAIVCAGLEPFDSWRDLLDLVKAFRKVSEDDIVIYTGYYPIEVKMVLDELKKFTNIIIKFGRFVPGYEKHYDELLGISLASPNQYAERIS